MQRLLGDQSKTKRTKRKLRYIKCYIINYYETDVWRHRAMWTHWCTIQSQIMRPHHAGSWCGEFEWWKCMVLYTLSSLFQYEMRPWFELCVWQETRPGAEKSWFVIETSHLKKKSSGPHMAYSILGSYVLWSHLPPVNKKVHWNGMFFIRSLDDLVQDHS